MPRGKTDELAYNFNRWRFGCWTSNVGPLRHPSNQGHLGLPKDPLGWVTASFPIGLDYPTNTML